MAKETRNFHNIPDGGNTGPAAHRAKDPDGAAAQAAEPARNNRVAGEDTASPSPGRQNNAWINLSDLPTGEEPGSASESPEHPQGYADTGASQSRFPDRNEAVPDRADGQQGTGQEGQREVQPVSDETVPAHADSKAKKRKRPAPPAEEEAPETTDDEALRTEYRMHLNKLFHAVKPSGRLEDLKDEIVDAMAERYYGALYHGEQPEQAYRIGIRSVGRVSEIIRNLRHDEELDYHRVRRTKILYAVGVALSVALFVTSAIVYLMISAKYPAGNPIPIAWLLGIAGAGVCVLIFFVISIPRYIRFDDTIVEEFKEWRSATSARVRTQRALSTLLWSAALALYLVLSFWLAAWAYTWILFLICFALDRAVAAFLSLRN